MSAIGLSRLFFVAALLGAPACRPRSARQGDAGRAPVVDAGRDSFIRHAVRPARGCPATTGANVGDGSLHGDTVSGVERWLAADSPHRVSYGIHVYAGASLIVDPCALVLVGAGAEVVVHGGATLRVEGEVGRPVRFARLDPQHAWQALEVRPEALAGTALHEVTLDGAGGPPAERGATAASLRLAMSAGLDARGLSITRGSGWGVAVLGDGRFADPGGTVALTGLQGEGAVTVEDVRRVGDLPRFEVRDNLNDDVRVEGRLRLLSESGRWRALSGGGRYRVRPHVHLVVEGPGDPTLTLEAGARMAFGEGAELDVGFGAPGALVAVGDAIHPVVFEGSEVGRWVGIQFGPRLSVARTRIAYARIEHAGDSSGSVLPTCGAGDARPDESMITFQGIDGLGTLHAVTFVDGPPSGFAVVVAGDFAGPATPYDLLAAALDFTRSRVRHPVSNPLRAGRCAPQGPRGAAIR